MFYFDCRTGALVDDAKYRLAIENRLAQRYPIVPVEGRVLEIIEKGREAAGIDDNDLGSLDSIIDRPPAIETSEEAVENVEREAEERRQAQLANAAVTGGTDPTPVGGPAEELAAGEQHRPADEGESAGADPQNLDQSQPSSGAATSVGTPVQTRSDGDDDSTAMDVDVEDQAGAREPGAESDLAQESDEGKPGKRTRSR